MSRLVKRLLGAPLLLRQTTFWCVWLIATTLMLLPASKLPTVNIWDKAEHAMTFSVLMLLVWVAYQHRYTNVKLALWLVSYGIAIECIQYLIPSRSFSVLDMVADSLGIAVIFLLVRYKKTV